MALTIHNAKHVNIPDPTQADLNAQIALGNYPVGTVLSDIFLASDANAALTVSGALDVANGGTGQTTANAGLNALLPTQTSNSGKFLTTDGTNSSWATAGGSSSTRGTFTNGTLSSGILTVTHSLGLSAPYMVNVVIFDNNAKQHIPGDVTGATNSVAIDLTAEGTLSGTWGYMISS